MSLEYPCVYYENEKCKKFSVDGVTSWCVQGPCDEQKMSNADRIRAMSDEELAIMFAVLRADLTRLDRPVRAYQGRDVNDNYDWLQQPAEGE